jgi:hypothetical protein
MAENGLAGPPAVGGYAPTAGKRFSCGETTKLTSIIFNPCTSDNASDNEKVKLISLFSYGNLHNSRYGVLGSH